MMKLLNWNDHDQAKTLTLPVSALVLRSAVLTTAVTVSLETASVPLATQANTVTLRPARADLGVTGPHAVRSAVTAHRRERAASSSPTRPSCQRAFQLRSAPLLRMRTEVVMR